MVPDMEKPRVTEFQVRIDCNGCVQKIKKALSGINGIQDIYIDVPQQKLTIIGWADLGKIAKALKKTRKLATICSETEPSISIKPESENCGPIPYPSNPSPQEPVPPVAPVEPPIEPHNPPPELEPEAAPPKEADQVHVAHRYPQDHSHSYNQQEVIYNATVECYSSSHHPQYELAPLQSIRVNHSYNRYKSTPYVTKYNYVHPPPQSTHYNRHEQPQLFTHFDRPEPSLQQTHHSVPEPPQHYAHYSRTEPPPPQQTHYSRPEPPLQQTRYTRPEPPLQYTHYNISEPLQPYTNYARQERPPQYTHYGGEYYSSSNGNGNITSIFSDENPNACTIV